MGCTASAQPGDHSSERNRLTSDQNNSGIQPGDDLNHHTPIPANPTSSQTALPANQTSGQTSISTNQTAIQAIPSTNQTVDQTTLSANQIGGEISMSTSAAKPTSVVPANQLSTETANPAACLSTKHTSDQKPDSSPSSTTPHSNQGNQKSTPPSSVLVTSEHRAQETFPNSPSKVPEKEVTSRAKENRNLNMAFKNSNEESLEDQQRFNANLKCLNLLTSPESFLADVRNKNIRKLMLTRALPHTVNLFEILSKLENLQVLDVSNNQLGAQPFRLLMLALASNGSIIWLNAANNMADTDCAPCIGRMLTSNQTLQYLDVSCNHLGKDYFSRCVGPVLHTNTSLNTLRLDSIGAVDMTALLEGLTHNFTLTDLDIGNNDITDRECVGQLLSQSLQKADCVLTRLSLKNCNMSPEGVESLREGLKGNSSLLDLCVTGNEVTFQADKYLENDGKILVIIP